MGDNQVHINAYIKGLSEINPTLRLKDFKIWACINTLKLKGYTFDEYSAAISKYTQPGGEKNQVWNKFSDLFRNVKVKFQGKSWNARECLFTL